MNLNQNSFCDIQSGKKTIEVRLNDEKRQALHIGDTIVFINRDNIEDQLSVKIKRLFFYPTFEDMFNTLGGKYRPQHTRESFEKSLHAYYTPEDEKKYGTVAIEIELMQ